MGGDQFYVTHCTSADSVLNAPGYSVRASTTLDPFLLKRALEYPPYELPLEMWKEKPAAIRAPRRLARTRDPSGFVWVVNTAHRPKDTVGRDRSYFSHLLRLPEADPASVLRSWAADEWKTEYPQGAPKSLPHDPQLPIGNLVNNEALTGFLVDDPPSPVELGLTVCPLRLRLSSAERRYLFARFLQAVGFAIEELGPRLYINAEPGLIALLLYGAIRLLPEEATADLTFSTYEPAQRNLKDFELAHVVGTYPGPSAALDPGLASRGIVLDTFNLARSSPVLGGHVPPHIVSLIDHAASGWGAPPAVGPRQPPTHSVTAPQDSGSFPKPIPDSLRTYSAQITRANPACLLLLIDQSGSMNEPFAGGLGQTKAVVVADAVNRLLQNVVLRSAKADGVRDYFRVGVIGYGKEIKAGLGGSIPFDILIPISRLGAHPLRVETRTKLIPNSVGGLISHPIRFPVWFDPETGGKTPMCEALATAGLAVKGFIEEFPDAYPPIVMNLTDGIPTDGTPQENARKIRNLSTSDGPVLLFNLLISSKPVTAEYFPASEEMFADNFSKLLFRMSSELPPAMWQAAKSEG
ncbi:MAG: VWA domain-containing protein, partial [Planctomycetes bacterium]|nr:VWA domain-containing protein [Planctomycetota bacterium]